MPGPAKPINPPFKPMLTVDATLFLEHLLTPESAVFEWGSGPSTLWLAQRVGHLHTMEHALDWYREVVEALTKYGYRADVKTHLTTGERFPGKIAVFPDEHFDLVLVDGLDRTRVACIESAMPKVKPGGWLVLDDSEWEMLKPACEWLKDWDVKIIRGTKRSWNGGKTVTAQTSFYQRPL